MKRTKPPSETKKKHLWPIEFQSEVFRFSDFYCISNKNIEPDINLNAQREREKDRDRDRERKTDINAQTANRNNKPHTYIHVMTKHQH